MKKSVLRILLQSLILALGMLGVFAFLHWQQVRFSGASNPHQLRLVLLCIAILLLTLPVLAIAELRAVAGQFLSTGRRLKLPLIGALPLALLACLLLWLQPEANPAPEEETPDQSVLFHEELFSPGRTPNRGVRGSGGELIEIERGQASPTDPQWHWVVVSGERWPLVLPPREIAIRPGLPNERTDAFRRLLGERRVSERVGGFPLAPLVSERRPDSAFAEPLTRMASVGHKVLCEESARLGNPFATNTTWGALGYQDEQQPFRSPSDSGTSYVLCMNYPGTIYWVQALNPVLSVQFSDGLPEYYLVSRNVPGLSGFDTLGETGFRQATGYLEGAMQTWRCRRWVTPAGGIFPSRALPVPRSTAMGFPSEYRMPSSSDTRQRGNWFLVFRWIAGLAGLASFLWILRG